MDFSTNQAEITMINLIENYETLDLMKLPKIIQRRCYEYHLLERTKAKCLYVQLDLKTKKHYAYEVFKNKIIDNHQFAKHLCAKKGIEFISENYPRWRESFPGDEAFGKSAWSFMKLDLAKEKYDLLK